MIQPTQEELDARRANLIAIADEIRGLGVMYRAGALDAVRSAFYSYNPIRLALAVTILAVVAIRWELWLIGGWFYTDWQNHGFRAAARAILARRVDKVQCRYQLGKAHVRLWHARGRAAWRSRSIFTRS